LVVFERSSTATHLDGLSLIIVMPSFPPPRCDQRSGRDQKGLDQLIEPLDPSHLKSESAAQEAFDNILLAKLAEKRSQLDKLRMERKKELAELRKKRPIPTRSLVFDPTTYTSMHDMKKVFTGSGRYIVKEVERLVPEGKYSSKKKWFLGVRLLPLSEEDKAEYERYEAEKRLPPTRNRSSEDESGDESSSEGSNDEEEDDAAAGDDAAAAAAPAAGDTDQDVRPGDTDPDVRGRRVSGRTRKVVVAKVEIDDSEKSDSSDDDDDEDDDPDCDVARKKNAEETTKGAIGAG